jgi:hypothetical protein
VHGVIVAINACLTVALVLAGMPTARMPRRAGHRFHWPGAVFLLPGRWCGFPACYDVSQLRAAGRVRPSAWGDLPGVPDGDLGETRAGGDAPASGSGELRACLGAALAVTRRPDREQARENAAAGALGRGSRRAGQGGGREGLGHRADGLATGQGERNPVGAGSGACCPAAWAPWMRSSWGAVIQARISCVTWCGVPERRIGPREGPAPVIADLSCPIVVSGAPRRRGYNRAGSPAG